MKKEELLKVAKPLVLKTDVVVNIASDGTNLVRLPIRIDISSADTDKNDATYLSVMDGDGDFHDVKDLCRFKAGDTIYIKEAWYNFAEGQFWYLADEELKGDDFCLDGENGLSFKSPVTMPKEAARFFLNVKSVHCERFNEKLDAIQKPSEWVWVVEFERIEDCE